MAVGLHISLSAEPLFTVGGLTVSNSMLTSLFVSGVLITFALLVRSRLKQTNEPSGIQNVAELLVETLYNLTLSVTQNERKAERFLPFIATFFMFIILNNWSGLLPGVGTIGVEFDELPGKHAQVPELLETRFAFAPTVAAATPDRAAIESEVKAAVENHNEATEQENHGTELDSAAAYDTEKGEKGHYGPIFVPIFRPGTADINTTLALAIVSQVMAQVMGISYLGLGYFKKFLNFSSPIMFFVGLLEIISEFAKVISYAFRLFGNIFAGEVLLVVLTFLGKVVIPMPFYGLEIFVGFIQALVFAMLTLVFFNIATISHDDH